MSRSENRPLTSLRAFAAIWVIFSHIAPSFSAQWTGASQRMLADGYMGVDVFFVLSGFILGIVYQRLELSTTPRFFLKRILRLYPLNIAILAALAVMSATIIPLGSWTDPHLLPLFILMLEGFKASPVPGWNPVTWSVGIELACYLCFPFVILCLRRLPTVFIVVLAVLLLIASWWIQGFCLGWPCGWHGVARGMSSFWPGVVLGTLALRLPPCPARWASIGELVCVGALLGVVAASNLRLVPVITGTFVLLLFFDAGIISRALRRQWIFWLGEISFSIYMLFGVLLPRMMVVETHLSHHFPPVAAIPMFIAIYLAVTFALAHATYVMIERPFRQLARPGRAAAA